MTRVTKTTRPTKRTLASVIETHLRERIINGHLEPGAQMNEVELATRYDTSRGPVREAIQRLVQEGLLVSSPHRGVFVPVLTDQDLNDLYFARSAIERAAVLAILDRGASAALIATLEEILTRMASDLESGDWRQVAATDLGFHEAVVAGSGSPQLSRMYSMLAGQTRLGLNLLVNTYRGRRDELLEEHTRLARALADSDQGILHELEHHFESALQALRDYQRPAGGETDVGGRQTA